MNSSLSKLLPAHAALIAELKQITKRRTGKPHLPPFDDLMNRCQQLHEEMQVYRQACEDSNERAIDGLSELREQLLTAEAALCIIHDIIIPDILEGK